MVMRRPATTVGAIREATGVTSARTTSAADAVGIADAETVAGSHEHSSPTGCLVKIIGRLAWFSMI